MEINKIGAAAAQLGKLGGQKILKKYGRKHFSKMGKKRWLLTKKQASGSIKSKVEI